MRIVNLAQRPDLADTCAAWSFGEWGCQMAGSLPDFIARYRERALNADKLPILWLAISNENKPMGMAGLKDFDHPDRPDLTPWLSSVYIHPLYRRQGVARALVFHAEHQAYSLFDCKTLYLYSSRHGEDLYRQLGWTEIGKVRDMTGCDSLGQSLMQKEIPDV